MKTKLTILAAAVAAVCAGPVRPALPADKPAADQKVENPQYRMWSAFQPGSSVRWVTKGLQGKAEFVNEATMTLKKVTAESVIVELKLSMTLGGATTASPAQDIEIAARVSPNLAPKMETTGQEDIQIGERKFSCRKIQTSKTTPDGTITITSWISDDLPGGLARSRTVITDKDGKEISNRTTEAVEFKVEK